MSMPVARRFRLAGSLVLATGIVLTVAIAPAQADSVYRKDLYFRDGYERQVDSRTCTAAAIAMMANFIVGRDLDLNQRAILRYEQERDALNDDVQRGSDPLGWSRGATAVTDFVGAGTTYAWVAHARQNAALRSAAWNIEHFGKPIGLLTKHGKHAVVMTGFEATADPDSGRDWTLLAVYVSDPLGASHARYAPANTSPLNRYWELDATAYYDRQWYNRWVMVVPRD